MDEEARTSVSDQTRESDERGSERAPGADREPTPEEEALADQVTADLEESGGLDRAADHEQEMNRLGAEVKGEGQIP